jgi:hypothetical protein
MTPREEQAMRTLTDRPRTRFWVEAASSAAGLVLGVLTLVTRDWVELVIGADPDGGSGALEWGVVGVLFAVAVLAGTLATVEWRRPRLA